MNNKKKFIVVIIIAIILLICIITMTIFKFINNYEDIEFYTIGNNKIPSITKVVGKRSVSSIKIKKEKTTSIKIIKYKNIDNVNSDIDNYIRELIDNQNFVNTTDINLNKNSGIIKLTKPAKEDKYIVIITIDYKPNNYSIKIQKGIGTINKY